MLNKNVEIKSGDRLFTCLLHPVLSCRISQTADLTGSCFIAPSCTKWPEDSLHNLQCVYCCFTRLSVHPLVGAKADQPPGGTARSVPLQGNRII